MALSAKRFPKGVKRRHHPIGHHADAHPRRQSRQEAAIPSVGPWLVRAAGATAIALVFFGFLFGLGRADGDIPHGVSILGVDLGGMTQSEAATALQRRVDTLHASLIDVDFDGRRYSVTPEQLGLSIDVASSVQVVGTLEAGGVDALLGTLRIGGGQRYEPVIKVDRPTLEQTLTFLLTERGIAAPDAAISVSPDGVVSVIPAGVGKRVDIDAFERSLRETVLADGALIVYASLVESPPLITDAMAEQAAVQARTYVGAPIELIQGNWRGTIDPSEFGPHLRVALDRSGAVVLDFDSAWLAAQAESAKVVLDRPVQEAERRDGGQFGRLVPASNGIEVQSGELVEAFRQALRSGLHQVLVPVRETAPVRPDNELAAELGIASVLAVGVSDFSGSEPGRVTNIRVSSTLIDGLLVPPGKTFSFNFGIGSIVHVPGYVPAGASENGIPGTAVGGGVCQVSTTLFRAALKAGLPILERWPHAFRSTYYEQGGWAPGFDASIQQPEGDPFGGSDFRFQNPTDGWLLIRSVIEDSVLTVTILGPETGFAVELDDPIYQNYWVASLLPEEEIDETLAPGTMIEVQPARDGVTMVIRRRVFDASGTLILADEFISVYEPAPAVYRVSPDMAGTTQG